MKEDPVGSGILYCDCCHTSVSNKKSCCHIHIKSKYHQEKKIKKDKSNAKETIISEYLSTDNMDSRMNGDTLDMNIRIKRMAVSRTFMIAGIPFNKLDDKVYGFKELVEESSGKLSVFHLRQLIPQNKEIELSLIRKEISNVFQHHFRWNYRCL